jgi:rhodanese-related sulfurtransferase
MKASTLGASALLLGVAAPFAGSPYRAPQHLDVDGLVGQIERGEDHVTALELAGWIRERKPGLRVIDVRTAEEFAAYSIPTAENIPLDRLARSSFREDETIVLYSEGGAHAGQAWVLLKALGRENIRFIAGGLVDWHYEVMAPVLAPDASAQDRQAFEAASELSRYFGGEPGLSPTQEPRAVGTATRPRVASLRRRGC